MESEDDDVSYPTKQKSKEEGKKESNGGLAPQLAVESEKHRRRSYLLRPRSFSKSIKKSLNHGKCGSLVLLSDDEGSKEDCEADVSVQKAALQKGRKTRKKILKDSEFLRDQKLVAVRRGTTILF